MVILDTNVLSELMRQGGSADVIAWLDSQIRTDVYTTSISTFEIRSGIAALPDGRRRDALGQAFSSFLKQGIDRRILPFDDPAAVQASTILAKRRAAGRAVGDFDTLIAGIAIVHGATLATRNLRDFNDLQIKLINPWIPR